MGKYNLKSAYCDLGELEKGGLAAIFGSGENSKGESIVDLKLGSLGEFANNSKDMEEYLSRGGGGACAGVGSSKRGRTPSNGAQAVCCLVDGCKSDLRKCRDYHRRHKVCEMHSKTPKVSIGGNEQRFCQQCSRFHSLVEFDEGKRSCRKRLEGHNRRRRKPQPETLPMPINHANFLSAGLGGKFVAFSNQSVIPASSLGSTMWPASISGAAYSHPYRGKQFPFLQCPESSLMLHHNPNPSANVDSTQKMFCNDLNQVISSDRNRALSLLSSSPTPAEITDIGLGRLIHPSPMHYNSFLEGGGEGGSEFMRSSNSLCQDDAYHNQSGSSSATASGEGGHQTLSFSWE